MLLKFLFQMAHIFHIAHHGCICNSAHHLPSPQGHFIVNLRSIYGQLKTLWSIHGQLTIDGRLKVN